VEQFGTGSRPEGVETIAESSLEFIRSRSGRLRRRVSTGYPSCLVFSMGVNHREWRFGPIRHQALGSVPPGVPAEEGSMEARRTPIARATVDSPSASPTVISRRAVLGGAAGGALVTLLARPELAWAEGPLIRGAPLIVLLRGRYQPVVDGPDLGLPGVDLNDGSYSVTKIYPVSGIQGLTDVLVSCGDFYVQFAGNLAAYDLPGGAIKMEFTGSNTENVDDGSGGIYVQGTFELDIPAATGSYRKFVGAHNTMVDSLHLLASGDADEFCVCLISRP